MTMVWMGVLKSAATHIIVRPSLIYSHYDILSDIMNIHDPGNICVDTISMIIIMHSFPDIEENLFFDNGGPHLHTHNMPIILQHVK